MKWRLLRWPVQILALASFVALAAAAAWPAESPIIPSTWLVIDPLVALVTLLSSRVLWHLAAWALVIVAATMLVGRFFCGWLCPLGTILDLSHRLLWRRRDRHGADEIQPRSRWKHVILLLMLAAAALGVSAGLILDPLVLTMRTVQVVLVPLFAWAGLGGVRLVREIPGQAAFSWPVLESPPLYDWMTVTALVFVGIVALGAVERRFWCRNLCPLGALLSLLSRTGLMKRYVESEQCTACSLCARDCPMGAIPPEFERTRKGECIQCLRCQAACRQHGVHFGATGEHDAPAFLPERRSALAALAGGVGVGLLGKASTESAARPAGLIRPPGAVPEREFLERCTRCLACVQACPTHGLQPFGADAGWESLWTPYLKATSGGCEEPCYNCGQVCPTGAIRDLPHEEKSFAKMGTARVIQERCLAWAELKACLVCDEVCPYDAIEFLTITDYRGTQRRPVVQQEKCMGCGLCERECPVLEARAIVVEHYGEERRSTGSYITPAKRQMREVGDDTDVDYLREYGSPDSASPYESEDDEPLPPAFLVD